MNARAAVGGDEAQPDRLGHQPHDIGVAVEFADQVVLDARLHTDRAAKRHRVRLHRDVATLLRGLRRTDGLKESRIGRSVRPLPRRWALREAEGPRCHPTHRGWPRARGIHRLTHDGPSLVPTCIRSVTKGVPVTAGTPSWFLESVPLESSLVRSLDPRRPKGKKKVGAIKCG